MLKKIWYDNLPTDGPKKKKKAHFAYLYLYFYAETTSNTVIRANYVPCILVLHCDVSCLRDVRNSKKCHRMSTPSTVPVDLLTLILPEKPAYYVVPTILQRVLCSSLVGGLVSASACEGVTSHLASSTVKDITKGS